MTLRWKKEDKPTGLSAVGANPNRGSYLHDGTKTYARTSPVGGGWNSGPLKGWYWVVPEDVVGQYMNTYKTPVATEQEAKDAAKNFIVQRLKEIQNATD